MCKKVADFFISLSPCCRGEHNKQGEYLQSSKEHIKAQDYLAQNRQSRNTVAEGVRVKTVADVADAGNGDHDAFSEIQPVKRQYHRGQNEREEIRNGKAPDRRDGFLIDIRLALCFDGCTVARYSVIVRVLFLAA